MENIVYIACLKENSGEVQSVCEHLNATAKLCREYSVDNFKDIVEAMGKLHDVGKYQYSFREKIKGRKNSYTESLKMYVTPRKRCDLYYFLTEKQYENQRPNQTVGEQRMISKEKRRKP